VHLKLKTILLHRFDPGSLPVLRPHLEQLCFGLYRLRVSVSENRIDMKSWRRFACVSFCHHVLYTSTASLSAFPAHSYRDSEIFIIPGVASFQAVLARPDSHFII
jgi:hypothetical protein